MSQKENSVGCKDCQFFKWSEDGVNGGSDCQHSSCFDFGQEVSQYQGKKITTRRRKLSYYKKNKNLNCKDFEQRTDFWYKIGSKLERFW